MTHLERIIVPEREENRLLEQQVSDLLDRAESEPDNFERWKLFQRLRDLTFSLRFPERGYSFWPYLIFASTLVMAAALWMSRTTRNTSYFIYPGNYLRIVQNLDPCLPDGSCGHRFVVQAVVNGSPQQETRVRFCESEHPHFEAGHVFRWIKYTNIGSCLALDGFDFVVGPSGHAIAATNCKPDYSIAPVVGHFNCEGGKAKFE